MIRLPMGWDLVTVDELAKLVQYGTSAKTSDTQDGVPVLRMGNIQGGRIVFSGFKSLPENHPEFPKLLLVDGDVLFNRTNSPELVGKTAIYRGDLKMSFASYLIRVQLTDRCLPEWLSYFLNSSYGRAWASESASQQVGQANISGGKLRALEVPLPSIQGQKQILALAGALLERCRGTRQSIADIPKLLDQYRQSILAAAFRGDLTAEWREQHSKVLEPATALLGRIRDERRARWHGRGAYHEPVVVKVDDLPAIPKEWAWVSLRSVAALKGGITKGNKRTGRVTTRPVPYLRVANVQRGHLNLEEVQTIEATEDEINELRLLPGDVLFNEGGDRDKLGRGWVWQGQLGECIHQNHVFRARFYESEWDSRLVSHWGNAFGRKYFQDEGKQTTNLASISLSKLGDFPVPVIPLAEQKVLIGVISKKLDAIDRLAEIVGTLTDDITTLESSILAKAFRGELIAKARE
jgi:type I restriction enzyme S subunit